MAPGKLYVCDAVFERLAPGREDLAAALGEVIQAAHAVVRPQNLTRHRHVTPTDQARIREGLVGGAKRASRDQGVRSPVSPATRVCSKTSPTAAASGASGARPLEGVEP